MTINLDSAIYKSLGIETRSFMKNIGCLLFLVLGCTLYHSENPTPETQMEVVRYNHYDSLLQVLKTRWYAQYQDIENEASRQAYFNTSAELVAHYLLAGDTIAADSVLQITENIDISRDSRLLAISNELELQKAYYLIATKQFQAAIFLFSRLQNATNAEALIGLSKTYLARYKSQYNEADVDTAFMYFRQAEQLNTSDHLQQIQQVHLADLYMRKLQLDSVHNILLRVLEEEHLAKEIRYEAHYYFNEWASRVGNHAALYEHAKKIVSYGEQLFPYNSNPLATSYLRISYAAERVGEIEKAIEYAEKANVINRKLGSKRGYIRNLTNLSNQYQRLQKTDQAFSCYQEALQIAYQEDYTYSIYSLHNDLGTLYHGEQQLDSAIYHHQKSLDLRIASLGVQHEYVARSRLAIAQTYLNAKDFTNAEQQLQMAVHNLKAQPNQNHNLLTTAYQKLARVYQQQANYQAALDYQQQALWQLQSSYDTTNVAQPIALNEPTVSDIKLLSVLGEKAETLQLLYEKTADSTYFQSAAAMYTNAFDLIDKLRNSVEDKASKNYLIAYHIYDNAFRHKFYEYKRTQSPTLLAEAFDIAEKSKSILLNESVKDSYAKLEANIAPDDVAEEKRLKKAIASLDKQIFEAQSKADTGRLEGLAATHFNLKREYEKFIEHLKTTYPQYYDLKYKVSTLSLVETQALLPDEATTLVEYVLSDSSIYAFVIRKSSVQVVEIKRDFPLRTWISQLRTNIIDSRGKGRHSDAQELAYADTIVRRAHQLHQKLIAPLEVMEALPKKLILVPEGVLGYLPFEVLLEQLPDDNTLVGRHAYLIKKHQISYAFSATLLAEMQQKVTPSHAQQLLAIAPSFPDDGRTDFQALAYNILEAKRVKSLVGGKVIAGEAASKSSFIRQAASAKILHLATHGKANDETGDYAYLAFSPSEDDFLLYNREVYALQIPAEMVVLSACETGIGELQVGEGIISLARGFSYAGAKSIITSLWSVNDQKTQELMESFYTYIKDDMPKDAALRQAKLDFIEKHFHEAHPFYWAAFIPLGDMTPVELSRWWW